MTDQYKPRGALFRNRQRNAELNHPHWNGDLELDSDIVNDLMAQLAAGNPRPKISLSAWDKDGPNAGPYISLSPSKKQDKKPTVQAPQNSAIAENRARPTPPPAPQGNDEKIPF